MTYKYTISEIITYYLAMCDFMIFELNALNLSFLNVLIFE